MTIRAMDPDPDEGATHDEAATEPDLTNLTDDEREALGLARMWPAPEIA